MALLAYNLTGSPVALAAGTPTVTLPASSNPPNRGPAVDVTSELRPNAAVDPTNGITGGVDAAGYAALQAQAASVQFEWTRDAEYLTTGLTVGGPTAGLHAASHQNGGGDEVSVAGLSGLLADPQTAAAHAASHASGGADEVDMVQHLGVIASFRLVQSGQPTATDTLAIGGDTYEADGAGANINFVVAGTAEGTLDNLLAAIQGSGTENIVASKLNATTLLIQSADAPNGTAVAADPSIAIVNGLTNYASSIGDANMNTLAGKAAGVVPFSVVELAITAAMVTATEARVTLPFTPVSVLPVVLSATGAIKAAGVDTFTISGDDVVIALGGADIAATDVVRLIAW